MNTLFVLSAASVIAGVYCDDYSTHGYSKHGGSVFGGGGSSGGFGGGLGGFEHLGRLSGELGGGGGPFGGLGGGDGGVRPIPGITKNDTIFHKKLKSTKSKIKIVYSHLESQNKNHLVTDLCI